MCVCMHACTSKCIFFFSFSQLGSSIDRSPPTCSYHLSVGQGGSGLPSRKSGGDTDGRYLYHMRSEKQKDLSVCV